MRYTKKKIGCLPRCVRSSIFRHLIFGSSIVVGCFFHGLIFASAGYSQENTDATTADVDCDSDAGVRCASSLYSDPGSAPPESTANDLSGNPINLLTGNKYQREVDFLLPDTDLQFIRHYNSLNADVNHGSGQGWRHSFDVSLTRIGSVENTAGFQLRQSTGKSVDFLTIDQDTAGNSLYRAQSASDGYLFQQDESKPNQLTWVLPDGRKLSFLGSYLVRIDYPGHRYLKLLYRNHKLAEINDETNRLITLHYSPPNTGLSKYGVDNHSIPGHIEKIVLPDGKEINYQYDDNKNLNRVIYPDESIRKYHYENETYPNHLTGITNRRGVRSSTWTYNASGMANSSTHANGVESVSLTYEVNDDGHSGYTTAVNSLNQATYYHWRHNENTGKKELFSSDGPGCTSCPAGNMQYIYNATGQLISASRLSGATKRYEYDEQGRLTEVYKTEHPLQQPNPVERLVLAYEYSDSHSLPLRIKRPSVNSDGFSELELEYNDDLLPIRLTQHGFTPIISEGSDPLKPDQFRPVSRTTHFNYVGGRLESMNGPQAGNLDTTSFGYDELHRINRISLPSGVRISYESFDAMGRITSIRIGENSTPIRLTYNDRNQALLISYRGRSQTHQYDAAGNLVQFTDWSGNTVSFNYDDADRVIIYRDNEGESNYYEFDTENQITQFRTASKTGRTIRAIDYAYDALGRLANQNQTEENASTGNVNISNSMYVHNQLGQLLSVLNSSNTNRIELSYGEQGQLARFSIIDGAGQSQSVSRLYDHKGEDIGFVDQRSNETLYVKDDFGQIVYQSHPDTGVVVNSYDESGNIVSTETESSAEARYTYDAANRMVESNIGASRAQFAYHPNNGKLIQAVNEHSSDEYSYNLIGDLVEHKQIIDGRSFSTQYEYTPTGQLSQKRLFDGQVLRYQYKDAFSDQPNDIELQTSFGLERRTLLSGVDTDASDGVLSHRYLDSFDRTVILYDDGRISTIQSGSAFSADYRYNNSGYVAEIDESDNVKRFGYLNGHLTSYSDKTGLYGYSYDAIGNQTSALEKLNNGSQDYRKFGYSAPGKGNQLLSVEQNGVKSDIGYSSNGTALSGLNGLSFEYDDKKRPVVVYKHQKKIAEYAYNSFGERIKKVAYSNSGRKVTYFLYESNRLVAEITPDDKSNHYLYSAEHPVIAIIDSALYAIHTDHLGTPRYLENTEGETVWAANYSPFGKATIIVGQLDFNVRFPGQYFDSETGNHYNYFRYYNPTLARYNSSDPIGIAGGNNTYLYANSNPLNFIDPLGLNSTNPLPSVEPPPARWGTYTPTPPNLNTRLPAANDPSAGMNPRTLAALRQLAARGGAASIIALSSYAGHKAGTSAREWVDFHADQSQVDELLVQIRRYNPDYHPGEFPLNWENIGALGGYLYGLQLQYYEFHTSVCSLDFDPNLFDSAVIALGPRYFYPGLLNNGPTPSPYVDPYRELFPSQENYDLAKQGYANYQASGGALSFLDWLSQIYWGDVDSAAHPGNGGPADPSVETPNDPPNEEPEDNTENNPVLDALTPEARQRAIIWADATNSNENWKWSDLDPAATETERSEARNNAKAAGLIPHVPVDPVTKYADFSDHVVETKQLPPRLWGATFEQQQTWLNNEIGGARAGMTWHHHEVSGRMQLVPFGLHRAYSHNGGCKVWSPNCRR